MTNIFSISAVYKVAKPNKKLHEKACPDFWLIVYIVQFRSTQPLRNNIYLVSRSGRQNVSHDR